MRLNWKVIAGAGAGGAALLYLLNRKPRVYVPQNVIIPGDAPDDVDPRDVISQSATVAASAINRVPQAWITVAGARVPLSGSALAIQYKCFKNVGVRQREPDLILVHDTAGEGDGIRIYDTLKRDGLSVEFAIDRDGVIWQFCDPAINYTFHSETESRRSIGVELANYVTPNISSDRPTLEEPYRSRTREVLGHLAPQHYAMAALVEALLSVFPSIPARVPISSAGPITGRRLPAGWEGVAGHLHFSDNHGDPALDILEGLRYGGLDAEVV